MENEVAIINIKMSFWSMVIFMVKWTVASIPAFVILVLLLIAIGDVFGIFGTFLSLLIR